MSFSSDIKETLCHAGAKCQNCKIACMAGVFEFAGREADGRIRFVTENEYAADYIIDTMQESLGIEVEYTKGARTCQFFLDKNSSAAGLIRNWKNKASPCCKRAYVRGAFLGGGSVTDPKSAYHLEFGTRDKDKAEELMEILNLNGISSKLTTRKDIYTIYIKECEAIADALSCMGAPHGGLELFSVQVEKDMRNRINRRVNCETANTDKMARAASKQLIAIRRIRDSGKWGALPDSLREIAELREQYPDMSLKELGERTSPPIGKSGVNHRLNRIITISENL